MSIIPKIMSSTPISASRKANFQTSLMSGADCHLVRIPWRTRTLPVRTACRAVIIMRSPKIIERTDKNIPTIRIKAFPKRVWDLLYPVAVLTALAIHRSGRDTSPLFQTPAQQLQLSFAFPIDQLNTLVHEPALSR